MYPEIEKNDEIQKLIIRAKELGVVADGLMPDDAAKSAKRELAAKRQAAFRERQHEQRNAEITALKQQIEQLQAALKTAMDGKPAAVAPELLKPTPVDAPQPVVQQPNPAIVPPAATPAPASEPPQAPETAPVTLIARIWRSIMRLFK